MNLNFLLSWPADKAALLANPRVPLIIYHSPCLDGTAAAAVALQYFCNKEWLEVCCWPTNYGQALPPPELCADRDIYTLDFSYPLHKMKSLLALANHVTVIDHHKTAEKDLFALGDGSHQNLTLVFNQAYSGASLTWKHLFNKLDAPWWVITTADHDLWKFEYADTKELVEALYLKAATPEALLEYIDTTSCGQIFEAGAVLLAKRHEQVAALIKNYDLYNFAGYQVPCINAPYFLASYVGDALTHLYPFVVIYSITPDGLKVSFRSSAQNPEAIDVSALAEGLGGGGHKHAASFIRNDYTNPLDYLL